MHDESQEFEISAVVRSFVMLNHTRLGRKEQITTFDQAI